MRKCKRCSRIYKYDTSKGHRLDFCNSCVVSQNRKKKTRRLLEYKGGKCIDCGYDRCSEALEFHHRDPATKSFSISGNTSRKWEVLKAEADKCDLVCANCHRERQYCSDGQMV